MTNVQWIVCDHGEQLHTEIGQRFRSIAQLRDLVASNQSRCTGAEFQDNDFIAPELAEPVGLSFCGSENEIGRCLANAGRIDLRQVVVPQRL